MVTETWWIKLGVGQVKDQIETYARSFPAWLQLQRFFGYKLFEESSTQKYPKFRSPHATSGT
jgi:hypothetical protein